MEKKHEPERVLRGGGWDFCQDYCRAAARDGFDPDGRGVYYGFRLVAKGGTCNGKET